MKIEVRKSPISGRGVFATKKILKGELIEICPVIFIDGQDEIDLISKTVLNNYYFEWEGDRTIIALGYGSLYNHSYTPNAVYEQPEEYLYVIALKDINPNEEITFNYNAEPDCQDKVWFDLD